MRTNMNTTNAAQAFVALSHFAPNTAFRWRELAIQLGAAADDPVSRFPDGSAVCWTGDGLYALPIEYIGG